MQKSLGLLLSAVLCFSLRASQASEPTKQKYEGYSIAYNLYDSTTNGAKGLLYGWLVSHIASDLMVLFMEYVARFYGKRKPVTDKDLAIGTSVFVTAYFMVIVFDSIMKKIILESSNAAEFNGKPREELAKEVSLREFCNCVGKTLGSGVALGWLIHNIPE